jgi:putative peptide zinc metalloprotease protein
MSDQTKKVALPAYLPRRLQAFRIVHGDQTSYLLRDKLLDKTHDLEPWQFFVLEVLPGCEDVGKLRSVFEDRFGRQITEPEILKFFGWLADNKLLDEESAAHPLLKPFTRQGYALEQGLVKPKSFQELTTMMAPATSAPKPGPTATPPTPPTAPPAAAGAGAAAGQPAIAEDATLPAGINEVENLDPRQAGRAIRLFEIRPFLQAMLPIVTPLRWVVYLLPFMFVSALILSIRYAPLGYDDLATLHELTDLAVHAAVSLFTINIAAVLTQAFVAQNFRATVGPLSIGFRFGFFPRFTVRIRHTDQLSRRERMWLHAGPLLMRLFLFSVGILIWYNTRDRFLFLSRAGLSVAFLCAVNIVLEGGNPLVKGNGYHLLAAFMDEPYLRGKSYRAFLDKLRGGGSSEADSNVLATYALANFAYAFVIVAVILMIVTRFLAQLQVGGATIIIALALAGYLVSRTIKRFSVISTAYERSVQFDRWRRRALPAEGGETKQAEPAKSRTAAYARTVLVLSLLLLLFLPYPYDAGGTFDIYPSDRQVITSDVSGVIEEVFFNGTESVKKGTVIARIAATDLKAQIAVQDAKIAEQKAVIKDLEARPKKEEIVVADRALDVAKKREKFSGDRVPRMERLYADRTISFEELDTARRDHEVDVDEVAKRAADLALVKTGTTPDRIAAERAKLDALGQEKATLVGKVERTEMRMPFDGNILTLHLNERVNSVLDRGQPFATVENTRAVTAQIEVPESEAGLVAIGATIKAKPNAFFDREFPGKVQMIDRNVTAKPFGNVVKVIAVIDNAKGELKTGMTGYAKIGATTMPVWKAFSLALVRFVNIQVWSWIP